MVSFLVSVVVVVVVYNLSSGSLKLINHLLPWSSGGLGHGT